MKGVIILELKRALRSIRGRTTLGVLLLMTLLSCVVGGGVARQHVRAGLRDQEAARARIELASKKETPPSALYLSMWQDNLIARGAAPGASLVAGELMSLPDAASVRLYEPPKMVPTLAERSPTATLLGTLDLAWLLIFLLPLAAIGLGFDSIALDRERGTLAMLLVPAKSSASLVWGRIIGLWGVLALGTAPAVLIGGVAGAVIAESQLSVPSLFMACVLVVAYCALLAAAVVAGSAFSQRSATALVLLLAGWLLFGIAVPLAASGLARLAFQMPDPRAELQGDLAAAEVMARPSDAMIEAAAKKDPPMSPDFGEDGVTSQNRYDFFLAKERYQRAKGARHERGVVMKRRAELISLSSWLSPTALVSSALSALAAGGPDERLMFEADAEKYRGGLEGFVRERLLKNESAFKEHQAWPKVQRTAHASMARAQVASALFVGAALLLAVCAILFLNAASLAPTKGDA